MLTSDELTVEQRAWEPATPTEAVRQWPFSPKIEMWDGCMVFYPFEGDWDWRSVAVAARAFPSSRVVLRDSGLLEVQGWSSADVPAGLLPR
jgi:hypothetical protein